MRRLRARFQHANGELIELDPAIVEMCHCVASFSGAAMPLTWICTIWSCGAHHAASHRGRLRIDGKPSTGLRIRHADGTPYGFVPSLADAGAKAFAALRNLDFPGKTARAALHQALATAPANASKEPSYALP
jgi:hypothetical protein